MQPRDEPQAAPPDSAGDAGSFTEPQDTFQVSPEQETGPETNKDPAPVKDLRPGASLWIAVVAVVIAIGAALYGYFWAVSGA